jgi:hypothetical protein
MIPIANQKRITLAFSCGARSAFKLQEEVHFLDEIESVVPPLSILLLCPGPLQYGYHGIISLLPGQR